MYYRIESVKFVYSNHGQMFLPTLRVSSNDPRSLLTIAPGNALVGVISKETGKDIETHLGGKSNGERATRVKQRGEILRDDGERPGSITVLIDTFESLRK